MGHPSARRGPDDLVAKLIVPGLLVIGVIGGAVVALTIGLMVSYDLRHAPASECAPVEQDGAAFYPCKSGAVYETSPSGVSLLVNFLTGHPEPERERWSTP